MSTKEKERVTISTGSRCSATGALLYRDKEKGTAVIQIGRKVIKGTEIIRSK